MSLAVALQMDPMETINIDGDSTFMLALEAQRRKHALFHYLPQDLSLMDGRVTARAREVTVRRKKGDHFSFGPTKLIDVATMDVVLMRQDPPFDMTYITATHLLEHLPPKVLVVNDPVEVRNAPDKLFVTHFDGVLPPTLIASNGGAGVFHLKPADDNLNALLEMFTARSREPIMVQKYLPAVRKGDKRIILIDGEPGGAVSRIPAAGEARANLHVGGRAAKTKLTPRDRELCAAIGPTLKAKGLVFVGIDVIGDYLTEINVTSPTGIQEINRLDGVKLERDLWDAIEARLKARRGPAKRTA